MANVKLKVGLTIKMELGESMNVNDLKSAVRRYCMENKFVVNTIELSADFYDEAKIANTIKTEKENMKGSLE